MGLLNLPPAQPGQATPPAAPPPGAPPASPPAPGGESRTIDSDTPNVTPEEQAEYDEFVKNGLRVIYNGGQANPEIIKSLSVKDSPDYKPGNGPSAPVLALAHTAVEVVSQLDDSSRKANKPVSDDVLMHGGIAIIEELADLAREAKIHTYTEDEVNGAFYLAVDMYRPKAIQDGRTTEDTLKGQFGEIVQADQQGKMDELLPGASRFLQKDEAGADEEK